MGKVKLTDLDTYVYMDASNIKNAFKTFGHEFDFNLLHEYLSKKYSSLKFVKYFEGFDKKDKDATKRFVELREIGYEVLTLARKSYFQPAQNRDFKCVKCGEKNKVEVLKGNCVFKSNIDVYLCSELMGDVLNFENPFHVVIFACDGDYAEMIRNLLKKNKNAHISVFATPYRKKKNYLSVRLKELDNLERYYLVNILNFKDKIKK